MAVVIRPKRRNSERRREKSRDAARTRRSKETEIFSELGQELPISNSILAQLDKASVVRLGITHLKLRQLFEKVVFAKPSASVVPVHPRFDHLVCRALDGFLILVDRDGTVVYITENIHHHLGLIQIDLLGHSVFDFIHPCDHDEMQDVISCRSSEGKNLDSSAFLRMKCTLTNRGRAYSVKSAFYKVVCCSGGMLSAEQYQLEPLNLSKTETETMSSLTLLMCRPVTNPSNSDVLLDCKTFVSHHNMDMSFVFCDDRVSALVGFEVNELLGTSLYDYHHALDSEVLQTSYRTLFSKGECVTGLYRFLVKGGGFVWMETQSCLVSDPDTNKSRFVVCVNCVVSEVLCHDEVFSTIQQPRLLAVVHNAKDEEDVEKIDADEEEGEAATLQEGSTEDEEGALFMTEEILSSAGRKATFSEDGDEFDILHEMIESEKHLVFYTAQEIYREDHEYVLLAPYISVDDIEFEAIEVGDDVMDKTVGQVDPGAEQALESTPPNVCDKSNNKPSMFQKTTKCNEWIRDAKVVTIVPDGTSKPSLFATEEPKAFFPPGADGRLVSFGFHKPGEPDAALPSDGSSVLKNLLLKGEDVRHGYRLTERNIAQFEVSADENTQENSSYSTILHHLLCSRDVA